MATKKCPHCAEEVLDSAKVCKHCGRDIKRKTSTAAWGCLIFLVLIGGCFVWTISNVPTDSTTASSSANSSKSSTPPATPASPAGPGEQWSKQISTSPIDDSQTVVLFVNAESEISGWPRKTTRPTLILRCKENRTELYVQTGMSPAVESGNLDGATVTMRLDSNDAESFQTTKSTDNEALFFKNPIGLIRSLLPHERMLFQFTPFNSSPQTTTFDISGLDAVLGDLRSACNW